MEDSHLGACCNERLILPIDGEALSLSGSGERMVLYCQNCGYASEAGKARAMKGSGPQEPPLSVERVQTPGCTTIESLAAFLEVPPSHTAKALLYARPGMNDLVIAVVRGDMQLAEGKLRAAVGDLEPATIEQIARAGAVPGYASPIGLRGVFVVVDDLVPRSTNLVAGANMEGFHLKNTNFDRDYTADQVADLTLAGAGDPCGVCGSSLVAAKGFMVADEEGLHPLSALLALAEEYHDERGLHLPAGLAPFDVYLANLSSRLVDTQAVSYGIYRKLEAAGIAVLFDDREARAGVKFNDADLIGCPIRITVGEKHFQERMVECKRRVGTSIELIPVDEIVPAIGSRIPLPR